jgi:hypothetical protein
MPPGYYPSTSTTTQPLHAAYTSHQNPPPPPPSRTPPPPHPHDRGEKRNVLIVSVLLLTGSNLYPSFRITIFSDSFVKFVTT